VRCLGMLLSGIGLDETTSRGEPMDDETLCILLNGSATPVSFVVPVLDSGAPWSVVFDTSITDIAAPRPLTALTYPLAGRSVVLLSADERQTTSIR
jgi:isoamylase